MMGKKTREFAIHTAISVEDLVPPGHFYRQLERTLDLPFVRELVSASYAVGGRPSVDPVVVFKLQRILFFEGLRSERQLLAVAADRLSLSWYLGYDLYEALPDHSSLTKIRERYGLGIFRRFFDVVVERCRAAGPVWGEELYLDATKVEANAARASLAPRFAVEAQLQALFPDDEATAPDPPPVAEADAAVPLPLVLLRCAGVVVVRAGGGRQWAGACRGGGGVYHVSRSAVSASQAAIVEGPPRRGIAASVTPRSYQPLRRLRRKACARHSTRAPARDLKPRIPPMRPLRCW